MTDPERASALQRAARILEERFAEIFEDYERRLEETGSLLVVGGGLSSERLEANAWSVISRAADVLRGEERSLFAVEEEIHQNIEASEEPLNPHPDESFRSGVALCKAAVKVVVGNLPEKAGRDEVAEIALAVQEIVMDRVSRMVMASYIDYLLTKVKETQFEERRRFSRELHDRLAHSMTVVTQSLDLYEAQRERDPRRAAERLVVARQTADDALGLMRQFSQELRGLETSDGLRIALENLMRISVPEGVDYEVTFTGEEEHLPDFVRDQLYLVLREGVRNAVAHSGSDRLEIEVSITPKEVLAIIRDEGLGFDAADPEAEGVGLDSMKERVELLGGVFELASKPDGGTRAEVHMPLVRRGGPPSKPE